MKKHQSPWDRWDDEEIRESNPIATLFWIIVYGVMSVFALYMLVHAIVVETENREKYYSAPQTQVSEYVSFFERHGSPAPVQMAQAIEAVKPENRPILAAVAVVESNGTPTAKGKASEKGAFQVIEKHWGPVSESPVQQALQAERILEELAASNARGSLRCKATLARYNGGSEPPRSSRRYAERVISIARSIQ